MNIDLFCSTERLCQPFIVKLPDIIILLFQNSSSKYCCSLATCQVKVNTLPEVLFVFKFLYLFLPMQIREIVSIVYHGGDIVSFKQEKPRNVISIWGHHINENIPVWEASCLLSFLFFFFFFFFFFRCDCICLISSHLTSQFHYK